MHLNKEVFYNKRSSKYIQNEKDKSFLTNYLILVCIVVGFLCVSFSITDHP